MPLPDRRLRILVAEDQAIVREGLRALVGYQPDMDVVGCAADGDEAARLYRGLRPDVTLMDLRMPKRGGLEAIADIREADPDARILVLTTFDGDEDIYRALRAGARGYLLKDAATEDLVGAIRAVARGERHVPAAVAQRLADRAMSGPPLSDREVDVLRLVAAGMTNKEIGSALFIAEGTVKTHVNSVHEKLGARDRTEAVMIAMRRGILHP